MPTHIAKISTASDYTHELLKSKGYSSDDFSKRGHLPATLSDEEYQKFLDDKKSWLLKEPTIHVPDPEEAAPAPKAAPKAKKPAQTGKKPGKSASKPKKDSE